eukprot:TRINITY_DN854_c0_g1_i2.p2 TRINITY_DN854_c0_g1~~TRINITY_DN854_c0_g1_i2.p2  ORF type:complete len:132 (-),score=49.39 TRINITY_DN854_c0_g1_i2:187-582(-)
MGSQAVSMFQAADTDGSGSMSFKELLKVMYPHAGAKEIQVMTKWAFPLKKKVENKVLKQITPSQMAELQGIFRIYDTDKNGTLDLEEFSSLAEATGAFVEGELESIFRQSDVNADDSISFEEFVEIFRDVM